ncbi:hypothetical protein F2Q68_00046748 [Brassica cretica]|uniref:Uncharacterized protein n=1 Tax=Brassica cretica TaxID=69181 RepID=A0A8S9LVB7_BRACR|nr:hypothetical protein F2Q68_00046748 [Brassica cretica]
MVVTIDAVLTRLAKPRVASKQACGFQIMELDDDYVEYVPVAKRRAMEEQKILQRKGKVLEVEEEASEKEKLAESKPSLLVQATQLKRDVPEMVYMCGNIEEGLLLKMLTKTGIQILGMDYGNLKPPPKKVEAQISDGTETQPKKDTEPPPEIVVTKHQAKNKKPRGFRSFCCS